MDKKLTIQDFLMMKKNGDRISMLTAYDASFASLIDAAGIDMVLLSRTCHRVVRTRYVWQWSRIVLSNAYILCQLLFKRWIYLRFFVFGQPIFKEMASSFSYFAGYHCEPIVVKGADA